jgi:hypothetical protein
LAILLDRCRTFKTLDEHAVKCAEDFAALNRGAAPPDAGAIRKHLAALAEGGLLISETAVLEECREFVETPSRIASVGVLTRNRTGGLERCLRSYVESCKRYGRTNDFVVMDDSETPATRDSARGVLSVLKREFGVEVSYAGREEKASFAGSLISEGGFEPDLVNFALTDSGGHEFSCGKNRNALFLHTVGDLVFSSDDDAVCRIVAPPASEGGREQEARGQPLTPVELWFFADREEALSAASFVEEEPLAVHERLLGRSLADCLASFGDVSLLSLERPLSHHLRGLRSDAGRVLVTLTGMIGDSGIRAPVTYKVLRRASRERLIESERAYLSARSSREVLRVATRYCVSSRTWFVSTALGFDNRKLLPPFFPVLRGTDGIFSETLRRCFEYGYFGDVPRAILHAPLKPRVYERDDIVRSAARVTMSSLMASLISSQHFRPGMPDGAEKMRALGQHLMELGTLSLRDFEEFARLHLWRARSGMISNLEKDLMDYRDAPHYWASDLKSYLGIMREALTKPEYVVPADLQEGRSLDEARELSRRLVLRFGRLLRNWPDLIEAARRLRARGERLAVPI